MSVNFQTLSEGGCALPASLFLHDCLLEVLMPSSPRACRHFCARAVAQDLEIS
jgi:hypothetical protein